MSSDTSRRRRLWIAGVRAIVVATASVPTIGGAARLASLELDPQSTVVRFVLPGTLHETHGTFSLERGAVDVDEATGDAQGSIVVDAASGATGNAARDRRMKEVVLEAGAHREIEFRPAHIAGTLDPQGDFVGSIHGVMTLLGVPHEIDVPTHGQITGTLLTASCHLSIPYVAWGLTDPSILFLDVAKEVAVEVSAVGHVQWKETPSR